LHQQEAEKQNVDVVVETSPDGFMGYGFFSEKTFV